MRSVPLNQLPEIFEQMTFSKWQIEKKTLCETINMSANPYEFHFMRFLFNSNLYFPGIGTFSSISNMNLGIGQGALTKQKSNYELFNNFK